MEKWRRQVVRYLFHYSARHLNIEQAFMAKDPHVPDKLYKYREFNDRHLKALRKCVLWRSSPDKFNDPYDTNVYFDSDRFFIENRKPEDAIAYAKTLSNEHSLKRPPLIENPIRAREWWENTFKKILSGISDDNRRFDELYEILDKFNKLQRKSQVINMTKKLQSGFGVLSLSELPTSILMWSHYSNSHTGFCIEYNFSDLPYHDLRRRLCFPVYYRKKLTNATRYLANTDLRNFNNLFGQYLCLLKSDEWAYEREWRIVFPTGSEFANDEITMPKPSSIILGIRVNSENKQKMIDFCKRHEITVMEARQRHDVFRLEVVPCF